MPDNITYSADIYLRLSKVDGDKEESDSIANQRALILEYLKTMPDICIHKVRIDDGYSGVDFNRPAFNQMIEDISAGVVNCVIVKDFSRFGRNYIEVGKYIQVLFPRSGIRFIAVNEAYDSLKANGYAGNIIVPFKNIVNDAYCADISIKVRSHLDIKRKKGDFVGAFAAYGYLKDKQNHNKLIIDSFAADVVCDIFNWKLEGLSAYSIAEKLNQSGVLSPMEYKRYIGLRYSTSFKVNTTAKWSAVAVKRILQNAVYTGNLEQGKRITPNYKVRKRIEVPKEQWICATDTHEPIIDRSAFDTVQALLKKDTRAGEKNRAVYPLSGVITCGDCGAAMVRKNNTKNGKRYPYYVCSSHRANKSECSTHNISAAMCESAVCAALKTHTTAMLDVEKIANYAENFAHSKHNISKLTERLYVKNSELKRYNDYRLSLYESYRDGVISAEDFKSFKANYDKKIHDAEEAVLTLKKEIELTKSEETGNRSCIGLIKSYMSTDALERKMVVEFIDSVKVYEKCKIEVIFRFQNELMRLFGGTEEAV